MLTNYSCRERERESCPGTPSFYRKEERTGLIPVASPYRLPKGGLRLSDASQRLSDLLLGGDI